MFEKEKPIRTTEQKRERFEIKIIEKPSDELVKNLVEIERSAFPEGMRLGEKTIREVLASGTPHIILESERIPVGYILTVLGETMGEERDSLYVWDIAIKPEARGIKAFKALGDRLIEEAKKRGYKRLFAHVRASQGLSRILQKRWGWKFLRRIENWAGFEEPFDYLEMEI